jgi:hypothetical protein
MKKITLLIAFTAFTIGLYAQSLTLSYPGGNINNGDTVDFVTDIYTDILPGEKLLFVHNTGTATAEVTCKKEVLDTIEGTKNSFCWGQCYPDYVYEPSTIVYIAAGDSSDESGFSGEYVPNGHEGNTYMKYYLTNTVNHDQITVVIKYQALPVSVNSYTQNPNKLNVSPNPASNQVNVDYAFNNSSNNTIVVKNLIGATMFTSEAVSSTGKLSINTSDFTDGIYFVTFLSNNLPQSTKKLIIKH